MGYLIAGLIGFAVGGFVVWYFDHEIAALGYAIKAGVTVTVLAVGLITIGWFVLTKTSVLKPDPVACPSRPAAHATTPKGVAASCPPNLPASHSARH